MLELARGNGETNQNEIKNNLVLDMESIERLYLKTEQCKQTTRFINEQTHYSNIKCNERKKKEETSEC